MLRIIVCGGRDYANTAKVHEVLTKVWAKYPEAVLVAGGARGADTLAANWAMQQQLVHEIHPARWATEGKAAGPKRNERMASLPDVVGVVAFPGGRGTAHMIQTATSKGLKVLVVK